MDHDENIKPDEVDLYEVTPLEFTVKTEVITKQIINTTKR